MKEKNTGRKPFSKSRLIKELSWSCQLPQTQVSAILDTLVGIARREAPNTFVLPGICKLEVVRRKPRKMRNPRTGESFMLPERDALRITAPRSLKLACAKVIAPAPAVSPAPAVAPAEASAPAVAPAAPAPVVAPTPVAAPIEDAVLTPTEPPAAAPMVEAAEAAPAEAVAAPVEQPVEQPAETTAEAVPAEPAFEPAAEAAAEVATEPAEQPVEGALAEQPVEAVETAAEVASAEVAAEAVEQPVEEAPAEQPVETAEDIQAEVAAEAAEQPVEAAGEAAEEVPAEQAEAQEQEEPPAPAPVIDPNILISFRCPRCQQEVEATGDLVGFETECPTCGNPMMVPAESEPGTIHAPGGHGEEDGLVRHAQTVSTREAESISPEKLKGLTIRIDVGSLGLDTPQPEEAKEEPQSEQMISFVCSACNQEIEASRDMIGETTVCPACGAPITVPAESAANTLHDDSQEKDPKVLKAMKGRTMRIDLGDDF